MCGGYRGAVAVHIGAVFSSDGNFQHLTRIAAVNGVAWHYAAVADCFALTVFYCVGGGAFRAPLIFRAVFWITGMRLKGVAAAQRFAYRQLATDSHGTDAWCYGFIHDGAAFSAAFGVVTVIIRRSGHGQCIS